MFGVKYHLFLNLIGQTNVLVFALRQPSGDQKNADWHVENTMHKMPNMPKKRGSARKMQESLLLIFDANPTPKKIVPSGFPFAGIEV